MSKGIPPSKGEKLTESQRRAFCKRGGCTGALSVCQAISSQLLHVLFRAKSCRRGFPLPRGKSLQKASAGLSVSEGDVLERFQSARQFHPSSFMYFFGLSHVEGDSPFQGGKAYRKP